VPAFLFSVYRCDNAFLGSFVVPAQRAALTAGQSITYVISTPSTAGAACSASGPSRTPPVRIQLQPLGTAGAAKPSTR